MYGFATIVDSTMKTITEELYAITDDDIIKPPRYGQRKIDGG